MVDKLLATLKRHNPSKVRAYAADDDHRDIAVPTRRKKWAQVVETINALSWVRVELLDKSGSVLAYVENTDPPAGLEDLDARAGTGHELRLAERICSLVLKGQRDAMSFRDAEVSALLKAQGDVVREMTAGMRALTAMYQEQVVASEQLAETRAAAAVQPEQGQLKELMDALPTILQLLPVLRGLAAGGDVRPNVNGHNKG